MNDATAVSITNSLFSLIGTICTGIIAYMIHRLDQKAAIAAHKVEQVKDTLSKSTTANSRKLDDIAKIGKDTHILVNSARGDQLRLAATLSRRIAVLTGDPRDIEAADKAEALLKDHERQQNIIDSNLEYGLEYPEEDKVDRVAGSE